MENRSIIKIGNVLSFHVHYQIINNYPNKTQGFNFNFSEMINETFSKDECFLCYSNEKNALYLPCRHNVACIKCSKLLKNCPICKKAIEDLLKIYKS